MRRGRPGSDTKKAPVRRGTPYRGLARWCAARDSNPEPALARWNRLSRDLVRDILTRPRPPRPAVELSDRMGVRSGGPRW